MSDFILSQNTEALSEPYGVHQQNSIFLSKALAPTPWKEAMSAPFSFNLPKVGKCHVSIHTLYWAGPMVH
jgi:hypothetical protein